MAALASNMYQIAYDYLLALSGSPDLARRYANDVFDFWYLNDPTYKFKPL